jgi:hypothetical protein
MLLLSRCDFLIHGVSAVSDIAIMFNPKLVENHWDVRMDGASQTKVARRRIPAP